VVFAYADGVQGVVLVEITIATKFLLGLTWSTAMFIGRFSRITPRCNHVGAQKRFSQGEAYLVALKYDVLVAVQLGQRGALVHVGGVLGGGQLRVGQPVVHAAHQVGLVVQDLHLTTLESGERCEMAVAALALQGRQIK
jgi:hypothetical protein